ncbi:MAG: hypothetical protein GY830_02995 [Bacteroidetes bacterium]|nr:hypothetical protein [Bacteroidota bacterium]
MNNTIENIFNITLLNESFLIENNTKNVTSNGTLLQEIDNVATINICENDIQTTKTIEKSTGVSKLDEDKTNNTSGNDNTLWYLAIIIPVAVIIAICCFIKIYYKRLSNQYEDPLDKYSYEI